MKKSKDDESTFRPVAPSVFYRGERGRRHRCRSFVPTHETQARIEKQRQRGLRNQTSEESKTSIESAE